MKRSRYTWHDDGMVLLIFDGNGPVSVTNDIEQVILDFRARNIEVDKRRVLYEDSEGRWDGITTRNGEFADFVLIGASCIADAIVAAHTPSHWD